MKRDIIFHRNRAQKTLEKLSLEDKLKLMYGTFEERLSLGLPFFDFSCEAAHGVQARHDQSFDFGPAVETTVFPNPIGMAASFDKEMMHEIGDVVGTEMRSLINEFRHNGLCGFAPTVDMERDPRWGRNEEAYGEDPRLTSRMAGEYILGMAGDDETYVRCGATLKHFYANNVEFERYTTNSVIPEDLKEDYYKRVFFETIDYASPMSVMSSYNMINGVTATFNPEIKELIERGIIFMVSDAGTLGFSVEGQKTASDGPDAIKKAFEAGIDMFLEDPKYDRDSMYEALEKGVITEADLDRALLNKLTAYSMLGIMMEDGDEDRTSRYFPKKIYNMSRVDTPESRLLSRKAAAKSTVLLKNEGLLPLKSTDNTFAFGPFVDRCPIDWYSGISSHTVTFKEGLGVGGATLYPKVKIKLEEGYAGISDGKVTAVDADKAEEFEIMLWDDCRITLRSLSTGKLLTSTSPEKKVVNAQSVGEEFTLYAAADEVFSWFVNEAFLLIDKDGEVVHFDNENALLFWEDPRIWGIKNHDGSLKMSFETIADSAALLDKVISENSLNSDTTIFSCFGLHPAINCKEEVDRDSIMLPPFQKAVLTLLEERFDKNVLILMANAPIAVTEEDSSSKIKAILWSAFGSEEFGNGLADIILGKTSPAGRLPQTWYKGDYQLGDINNYDIRSSKMTYLYMEDEPLYRFGYGLTYSDFEAELISIENDPPQFTVRIKNTGHVTSDFVVQIYESPEGKYYLYTDDRSGNDASGVKIPVGSRLVAFTRVHDLQAGEEISSKFE
ncbi:MAG: glycoside hydrolase family 3 C-terminal domain-containing protein [Eubacterium sp.]|nr:glycoside hydrolase family 3 C-terminal domain-containing protein [Eubacterium sp.]